MKKILLLISVSFLLFSCAQDNIEKKPEPIIDNNELTAVDFVKGSEDVPLLNHLDIIEDNNNLNFDSISGSVSTVDYKSQIDLEVVQNFYLETLPQMGWKMVATDPKVSSFTRDNEKIEIEFIEAEYEDDPDIVRFHLSSVTEEENLPKDETPKFKIKSENSSKSAKSKTRHIKFKLP